MDPQERLRLAAALVHSVPGGELRLQCGTGQTIVVGCRPDADIDPCSMRNVAIAGAADHADRIERIEVAGSLEDLGGGVSRSQTTCGLEQRWLATSLDPTSVHEVLDSVDGGTVPDDALHATLKADTDLGVTVVGMTALSPASAALLDEVAASTAAACFAEELVRSATAAPPPHGWI